MSSDMGSVPDPKKLTSHHKLLTM